jgi:hypothetical protein
MARHTISIYSKSSTNVYKKLQTKLSIPKPNKKLNFKPNWLYPFFLTNLEDEISIKGVGFVKPKIGIRKKNNKMNK